MLCIRRPTYMDAVKLKDSEYDAFAEQFFIFTLLNSHAFFRIKCLRKQASDEGGISKL